MNEMLFSWNFLNYFENRLTYELMLKRRHLCVILGLNLHVKYHDGRFCFVGCHENEHPQWGGSNILVLIFSICLSYF